jgi:hypothetical protein
MSAKMRALRVLLIASTVLCTIACASLIDPVAEEAFMANLGDTSMTVFPAYLRIADTEDYAPDAATEIAAWFDAEGLAETTVSEAQVPITGAWHSNQMLMWQESAAALAEYVQANPIATEYALLAEYITLGGNGGIGGVHCYIVDAAGKVAYGFLTNSHHDIFNEINPQTTADCTELVITVLQEDLQTNE